MPEVSGSVLDVDVLNDARSRSELQIPSLPHEVKFCRLCVVSNQRPRIEFDDWGVCSACRFRFYRDHIVDWTKREADLRSMVETLRQQQSGSFDVVVPASGGKDSVRVAGILKDQYGLNPITATWAPFEYTEVGWRNFKSFIDSGFSNILAHANGVLHRQLSRASFFLLGDAWQPFTYGQACFPFHVAKWFGLSTVMIGENAEAEYGGDVSIRDAMGMNFDQWKVNYFKGATVRDLVSSARAIGMMGSDFDERDLDFYDLPRFKEGVDVIPAERFFSYFVPWVPQKNYFYAVERTGFEANPEGRSEGTYSKYASLDDRLDGFHYYLAYIKFGIGRCTSDAAHEIRDGHITRDEGVALVKRFDGEFPNRHFKDFLEYLDIDEGQFRQVVDSWRRPEIWRKSGDDWELCHAVYRDADAVEPLVGKELKKWQASIA